MKTLGRILVIMIAFIIVMGLTYSVVGASGSSTNTRAFRKGGERFAPNGEQREFREEGDAGGGFGMMFGLLKNTIIVAVIVALIAFPKNLLKQKRRAVPVRVK